MLMIVVARCFWFDQSQHIEVNYTPSQRINSGIMISDRILKGGRKSRQLLSIKVLYLISIRLENVVD